MSKDAPNVRYAEIDRVTRETNIHVVVDLDGGTRRDVQTGVPFFDHMLHQLAFYGCIDLGVSAEGDLHIDDHHTVEDVGICLGRGIRSALENSPSIERFGSAHGVMDESLVLVAMDISGRGMLTWDCPWTREKIGGLSTENVREFFRAFTQHSGITLHIQKLAGENDHHVCEAIFKGFGLALCRAVTRNERRGGPSTKGSLD